MSEQPEPGPAEWMRKVAEGDPQAFMQLYDHFSSKVYGLALHMTKDPAAAEEVSQEAFIKAWASADTFRANRGSVSAWLLTITRRTAIDRFRKQSRRPEVLEQVEIEADWNPAMSEPLTNTEESRWRTLYFALQELPVEQQQVIVLSYYHGLSHSQIAAHLNIPLGTAKTRIRLGMEKLRLSWFEPGERSDSS